MGGGELQDYILSFFLLVEGSPDPMKVIASGHLTLSERDLYAVRTALKTQGSQKMVPKVTTLLLKGCQRISKVVKRLSY